MIKLFLITKGEKCVKSDSEVSKSVAERIEDWKKAMILLKERSVNYKHKMNFCAFLYALQISSFFSFASLFGCTKYAPSTVYTSSVNDTKICAYL